jgi:hypothetical protein
MLWGALVAVASVSAVAAATAAASIASAAATAASAAEATAAATTAAASSAAEAPFLAGAGLVDGEGAAIVLLAVEGLNGCLGFVVVRHLDEPETFTAAGVAIVDHLGRKNLAVLAKQLLEFRAIHLVAQVPDVQLLSH